MVYRAIQKGNTNAAQVTNSAVKTPPFIAEIAYVHVVVEIRRGLRCGFADAR